MLWAIPIIALPGLLLCLTYRPSFRVLAYALLGCAVPITVNLYLASQKQITAGPYDGTAKVVSSVKQTSNRYHFMVKDRQSKALLKVSGISDPAPSHGDIVHLIGTLNKARPLRNPGQFDQGAYWRRRKIKGQLFAEKIVIQEKKKAPKLFAAASWIRKRIHNAHFSSLPKEKATLLIGLLIGDEGIRLDDDMKDQFRRVGLSHLLVVSGSQVSLISGICFLLFSSVIRERRTLFGLTALCNAFFYVLTGGGPSIFRATFINLLAVGLRLREGHCHPVYLIAFTALAMLLVNPLFLVDVGAHLSFLATIAIIFGIPVANRYLPQSWPDWMKNCLSLAIVPFILTAPLLWYHFQVLSPVSILANLATGLVTEWIVVLGFVASFLGLFSKTLCFLIDLSLLPLLSALQAMASLLSSRHWANIHLSAPSWPVILLIYIWLIAFLSPKNDVKTYKIAHHLLGAIIVIILILPSTREKELEIYVLDVGQGDACLIVTPNKQSILVDGGNRKIRSDGSLLYDAGKYVIAPALRHLGINKIDMVVITHYDQDHIGGLASALRHLPIGVVVENGKKQIARTQLLNTLDIRDHQLKSMHRPQSVSLESDLRLHFLYPFTSAWRLAGKNNNSVTFQLTYRNFSMLFTGDLEADAEQLLVNAYGDNLASTVLKLGHHGSKTSTTLPFLSKVSPQIGIASAGQNNRYGHPSTQVVNRLKRHEIPLWRTDQHGAIVLKTDGKQLSISPYLGEKKELKQLAH